LFDIRYSGVNNPIRCESDPRLEFLEKEFNQALSIGKWVHRRTRWGVGGSGSPHCLKTFRASSVFRASATCSKILNDKKYIFNTVNTGQTLFFRASLNFLKNPECKKYIQYSENFQGKL